MKYKALRLYFIIIFYLWPLCLVFLRTTCRALEGKAGHTSIVETWQRWAEVIFFMHHSALSWKPLWKRYHNHKTESSVSLVSVCTCSLAVVEAQALNASLVISLGGRFKSCALKQVSPSY